MNGIQYPATPMTDLRAMVLYCMECRATRAHRLFLENELDLPEGSYKPVVGPGGIAGVSRMSKLKAERAFKPVEFTLHKFPQVGEAHIIFHDDCGLYKTLRDKYDDFYGEGDVMTNRQLADHRAAAAMIRECKPDVRVHIYRAIAIGVGPTHWSFVEL